MTKKQIPQTSKDAYSSLRPEDMAEVYRLILWSLTQLKEGSMEDIARACRMPKERIWKRLSELAANGLIYRPGNTKVLSSGRKGFTWRLVEGSTPPEKVTEKVMDGPTVADISRKIQQLTLL